MPVLAAKDQDWRGRCACLQVAWWELACFVLVVQSQSPCPTPCNTMDCSTPGFPVPHISRSLLKLMSIELVMSSNHLTLCYPPSPPALNLSQHQGLFQWVSPLHQVAKVLELQLQPQSFQWIFRVVFFQNWLVWSPCSPRDSQESSPTPQLESINSLVLSLLYGPTLTSVHDLKKKAQVCVASWLRPQLPPKLSIPESPAVSLGERDEYTARQLSLAAPARLYFIVMPTKLPSAFGMGKFRHQSGLSKKFRFHVFSQRGGMLTDSAHVIHGLSSKAVDPRLQGWTGCLLLLPDHPLFFFQIWTFKQGFATWSWSGSPQKETPLNMLACWRQWPCKLNSARKYCLIDFLKKKKSIMFLWACLLICSPTEVMKKLCDQ